MIKIGDFSRMGGVSIATLRHYDEAGILRPIHVDEGTNYRYYDIGQIWQLRRILALKDLGLSLQEIVPILASEQSSEDFRRLLERKFADVQLRVDQEIARLKRIEHRILLIDKENVMSNTKVQLMTVSPLLVAYSRISIPTNDQAGALLGEAYESLMREIHSRGRQSAGSCMAVWYSPPDSFTDEVVEAAVPIASPDDIEDSEKVQILPEVEVASITHRGPFEEFIDGHRILTSWMEEEGYILAGPYREIYHSHTPSESVTEIQYPVEKR